MNKIKFQQIYKEIDNIDDNKIFIQLYLNNQKVISKL